MAEHETKVTWRDPAEGLAHLPHLDGIDYLTKMMVGDLVCTLLDSALGCATHTTLPAGTGRVTKEGRRVAFAEGEAIDNAGRVVATASGSLLVFPSPT